MFISVAFGCLTYAFVTHDFSVEYVAAHSNSRLPLPYRIAGDLTVTDTIMNRGFWVGVYPGLTGAMRDYVASELRAFAR